VGLSRETVPPVGHDEEGEEEEGSEREEEEGLEVVGAGRAVGRIMDQMLAVQMRMRELTALMQRGGI
jgi:hypothetical protein